MREIRVVFCKERESYFAYPVEEVCVHVGGLSSSLKGSIFELYSNALSIFGLAEQALELYEQGEEEELLFNMYEQAFGKTCNDTFLANKSLHEVRLQMKALARDITTNSYQITMETTDGLY